MSDSPERRADQDSDRQEAERKADRSNRDLEFADDRGGSRDGERLAPGEPGDRDQLDNAGGRTPSRR